MLVFMTIPRWLTGTMVVLASCLLACGDDPPSDPPPPGEEVSWEAAFDTTAAGSLSGVWGSSPNDVFIVGGTDVGGEIYHYDGSSWWSDAISSVGSYSTLGDPISIAVDASDQVHITWYDANDASLRYAKGL